LYTVIGVLRNAHTVTLFKPDPMLVYMPYWYRANTSGGLIVRTALPSSALAASLRHIVTEMDGSSVVAEVRPLSGIAVDSAGAARFEMDLLIVFAIAASLLAALGIYGVVSYSVAQREREIGLRVAVGAQMRDIVALILQQSMRPVLMGTLAGVAIAFACGRLLTSLLYNTSPYSLPVTLVAITASLVLGVVACGVPAWRAVAVDPVRVLREQ
jgi:predicted lysophospholipase L1 biosynthesis ABC-type transport system permease subunit